MRGRELAGRPARRRRVTPPRTLSWPSARALARGLGWFSVGLGAAELLAPGAITRRIGLRGHEGLAQAYGLREFGTGLGILATENPAPWIWGRVGGDALDIATVATGLRDPSTRSVTALALLSLAGVTALDVFCGRQLGAWGRGGSGD